MNHLRSLMFGALLLSIAAGARAEQFNALLFTKTAGYHHESINAGVDAVQDIARLHYFQVFWTADASVFKDEELAKYQVVIFLLTTGDVLDQAQQAALERFVRKGGGFVGVHSASDTEYEWPWYTKMVGHLFHRHPVVQTAFIDVKDRNFPGMERFPQRFLWTEEWYEFKPPLSDQLHYLLAVDDRSYRTTPNQGPQRSAGVGDLHPMSWYQNYDGGRAFYTGLGHLPATYSDALFRHHLYGGIYWAATGKGIE